MSDLCASVAAGAARRERPALLIMTTVWPVWRRGRGVLLRLATRRTTGLGVGSILLAVAAWLVAADYPWESWYTDGLALVLGASGAALAIATIGGRRPDWIEPGTR